MFEEYLKSVLADWQVAGSSAEFLDEAEKAAPGSVPGEQVIRSRPVLTIGSVEGNSALAAAEQRGHLWVNLLARRQWARCEPWGTLCNILRTWRSEPPFCWRPH